MRATTKHHQDSAANRLAVMELLSHDTPPEGIAAKVKWVVDAIDTTELEPAKKTMQLISEKDWGFSFKVTQSDKREHQEVSVWWKGLVVAKCEYENEELVWENFFNALEKAMEEDEDNEENWDSPDADSDSEE